MKITAKLIVVDGVSEITSSLDRGLKGTGSKRQWPGSFRLIKPENANVNYIDYVAFIPERGAAPIGRLLFRPGGPVSF